MENLKCKINASPQHLKGLNINYHLTGLIGYVQSESKVGWYNVKIENVRINSWINNDIIIDIPKSFVTLYPPNTSDFVIYVDMDGVLADYHTARHKALEANPDIKYPQSQYGFFANLDVIPNKFNYLAKYFNVQILTSPSARNPMCYTEKRVWVEKHLGLEAAMTMNLVPDKSAMGTEKDYLIDDITVHERSKQQDFRGKLIHFGSDKFSDWTKVATYFEKKYQLNLVKKC